MQGGNSWHTPGRNPPREREAVTGEWMTRCSGRAMSCVSESPRVLLLVGLLAADGLQLSEHRIDVEVVALLFARLEFRLLAGGLRGRQQGGAAIGGVRRLLLGRALYLEVELDLRAQGERQRV